MKAIKFTEKLSNAIISFYNECSLSESLENKQMNEIEYYQEGGFFVLILETKNHRYEQEIEITDTDEFDVKKVHKYE